MKTKLKKAIQKAKLLPMATQEILEGIPDNLKDKLTSRELAEVMLAMNASYHSGRASTGAEKIDTDCVWIDGIGMMEIVEEGAEYEYETITDNSHGYTSVTTRQIKTKSGRLIGIISQ